MRDRFGDLDSKDFCAGGAGDKAGCVIEYGCAGHLRGHRVEKLIIVDET